MFGPRITTVFRSRWRALWWALSILVGAYFSIPSEQAKDNADAQNDARAAVALFQHGQPEPAKHVNPWAKDSQ